MNFDANWQKAAAQMQETFNGLTKQSAGSTQSPVQFDAAKLQLIQQTYIEGAAALWAVQARSTVSGVSHWRLVRESWET